MSGLWFPAPLFDSPRSRLTARRWVVLLLVASLLAGFGVAMPAAAPGVLATGSTGSNAIWYVGPGSGPGPCAFPDFTAGVYVLGGGDGSDDEAIQGAVNAASSGDVVHLCTGIYDLSAGIVWSGKSLTFEGDSSAATVVDGHHSVRLFNANGSAATFRDLTLQGGWEQFVGGVLAAPVAMSDVRLFDNSTSSNPGGAIRCDGALSLTRVLAVGNFASGGGVAYVNGLLTIVDSEFAENTSGTIGGAVYHVGAGAVISGSVFRDNQNTNAGYGGGALAVTDLTVGSSLFQGNRSFGNGGAISANSVRATSVEFRDNTANAGGAVIANDIGGVFAGSLLVFVGNRATGSGGGLVAYGSVAVTDATFVDNSSGTVGGAILAQFATVVDHAVFTGNVSRLAGGAVYTYGPGAITNASFRGNTTLPTVAGSGGGAAFFGQAASVINSTFVENTSGTVGGAIRSESATPFSFAVTGSTFVDNTAGGLGRQISVAATSTASHSLFVGGICSGTISNLGGNVSTVASCPGSVFPRSAINLDSPQADGTIPLLKGSVAIDPTSGTGRVCTLVTDQRGQPRPGLASCDAGAFEYQGSADHTTGISIAAAVNGMDAGPTLTTGDVVTVSATVSILTADTDLTAGLVVFKVCTDPNSTPASCGVDGSTFSTVAVTQGTPDLTVGATATLSGLSGGRFYRLGAYFGVAGGVFGSSETTTGTPTFRVTTPVTTTWDVTTGASIVLGTSSTAVMPLRAYTRVGGTGQGGCRVGFTIDRVTSGTPWSTWVDQLSTSSGDIGLAAASVELSAGVYQVSVTTGEACSSTTPAWGTLTVAKPLPRGTVGTIAGGRHFLAGSSGDSVAFGLLVDATSASGRVNGVRVTTTTTNVKLVWISSNGWRLTATSGDVTTGSPPPWQSQACTSFSASDGINAPASWSKSYKCGQLVFRGRLEQWTGAAWTLVSDTTTFTARLADGGATRTGENTDFFGLQFTGVVDAAVPSTGAALRPLRWGTSATYWGKVAIY